MDKQINDNCKKILASCVISEIQQSDIYLTVKARLFESPGANLNGVRVTSEFIDEIVGNQNKYVGLPLYADVRNLLNGNYEHLGHLYDPMTGEFHSVQIGSFYQFEKEELGEGAALVGLARVPKRNKEMSKAIGELFAEGRLKFSFEITCNRYAELEDGTIQIDADKTNYLEGMAIVSSPACESAVALDLVAQALKQQEETEQITEEGEQEMQNEQMPVTEVAEEKHEEIIAQEVTAEEEVVSEVNTASEIAAQPEETAEETAECKCKKSEEEEDPKEEKPCEDCEEEKTEDAACKKRAEFPPEKEEEKPEEEEKEECAEVEAELKAQAEKDKAEMDVKIAELEKSIISLRAEIEVLRDELKKPVEVATVEVAEAKEEIAEVNPFVSDIEIGNTYSLLASCEKPNTKRYSLLDRA